MKKQDFVDIITKLAEKHALDSEDDFESIEDKEELYDIADDAWNHAAIPDLEWMFGDDPKSRYTKMGIQIHDEIEKYGLGQVYAKEFVKAIIKKFKLTF